jgi:hypothetical protein
MTVLTKVENHMACWIFTDQKRHHDEASVAPLLPPMVGEAQVQVNTMNPVR